MGPTTPIPPESLHETAIAIERRVPLPPSDGPMAQARGPEARFRLEELEVRQVLSTFVVPITADQLKSHGDFLGNAGASTIVVQNTADQGVGSLRDAIEAANNNPAYNDIFIDVTGQITLKRALPDLMGNYKIEGPGADKLTIERDQGTEYRIFTVDGGAHVELDGLTVYGEQPPRPAPGPRTAAGSKTWGR